MKKKLLILPIIISAALGLNGCVTAIVAGSAATIAGVATVSTDKRTFGSQIDDEMIESVAITEIESIDKIGYSMSHIGATSIDGLLLIHGQTPSQLIKDGIPKTCTKIKGVKKVFNAVSLQEPISLSQRSKDTWITSKVKSKLLTTSDVNSGRFKVVTENSVVYLMGLVTPSEAAIAANVTAETDGVTKVVKLFQYISDDTVQQTNQNEKDNKQNTTTQTLESDSIEVTDL